MRSATTNGRASRYHVITTASILLFFGDLFSSLRRENNKMEQAYKFELARILSSHQVESQENEDAILKKWNLVKLKVKTPLEGLT